MSQKILYLLTALLFWGCNEPAADQQQETGPETTEVEVGVERLSAELDRLVSPDAQLEVLGEGYKWSEGPLWLPSLDLLIFSDVPENKIYYWKEGEGVQLYLQPSGYTGDESPTREGSNGLLLDPEGRLVLCQHGDRRVARMEAPLDEPAADFSTIVDRYEGKRFNSPNDLVYDSRGNLYFTDPPYGLPQQAEDPERELDHHGVYRLGADGQLTLLTDELSRPNGIALSPDEKTLYVANSDPERAIWMAYDLSAEGQISNGRVLFDATERVPDEPGLPDGLKVDKEGYLFATGPGGVFVFKPDGMHLGTIRTGRATANCAFNADQTALYMTADDRLMRIGLVVR